MLEIRDGRYVITLPKCVLVLTKSAFIAALKAGKAYKRTTAIAKRHETATRNRGAD
jgi:hypothetical protein